jgi:hypothetical protein
MSAPEGTVATCPCVNVGGYRVRVEIRIVPEQVRSLTGEGQPVENEEAQRFLHDLWKDDLKPIKDALRELWS